MLATLENQLERLAHGGHAALLTQTRQGIEKEGLRVSPDAHIAQTPHPRGLGSALTHDFITTDYSEALLEFITPVHDTPAEALAFLNQLHAFTYRQLGDEQLWCASMPCEIPSEEAIPIAEYGSSNVGRLKHVYRQGLKYRYGKMMQTIAGIHYNFSLPDAFWPVWQQLEGNSDSLQAFRSAGYFRLIRNFRRYGWLLLYLFGASPALSASFMAGRSHSLEQLDPDTLYLPHATSLRMSDLGYSNKAQADLQICFNHLDTYAESLHRAIHTSHPAYEQIGIKVDGHYRQLNTNVLQIENEYYSDVRPKRVTQSGEKPVHALMHRGVEYVEVRNTDINPLLPLGIDNAQADFLNAFLISCLLGQADDLDERECGLVAENHARIVNRGREPGLLLHSRNGERPREELAEQILDKVLRTAELLDDIKGGDAHQRAVQAQRDKVANPELTPSAQVLNALRESGLSHSEWVLEMSRQHRSSIEPQLTADTADRLQQAAVESLDQQAELEAAPAPDFADYLADYIAG
ncbi:glutamate--cysteine ligase [Marinobacterium sediminicola]|uniref:Glutamate--cysteine ligase n=1 Tax=Marinobacterium sediminicola TaxID=518898 RepID=A0ABY1S1N1_9GAMM|nr:glutamate--cysteine ligase [Marinobacterium sediminicola]ULG69338.1 glutamate--cysteine ligase [Marinobacterium sediminicola]SMR75483.1 glutamate-cysteine ligase [Marinobacterium sediminicola]